LIPFRAFVAAFFTTTNFAKPGTTNAPVFLSSLYPISATASMTPLTSFRAISVGCCSTIFLQIPAHRGQRSCDCGQFVKIV
jgi:hypothetical protein